MKAVILCGGQGTRIRDASETLPKPMLPIGGKPVLWHIMKGYAAHGIREFVLCLGYKGWLIKEFFLPCPTNETLERLKNVLLPLSAELAIVRQLFVEVRHRIRVDGLDETANMAWDVLESISPSTIG